MVEFFKNKFKGDTHINEFLKGSLLTFLVKIFGAAVAFIFNLLLARELPIQDVGIFYLGLTAVMFISTIGRIGLDKAVFVKLTYFLGSNKVSHEKTVISTAQILIFVTSTLLSIITFIFSEEISRYVFNKLILTEILQTMSIAIIAISLINLFSETLRAYKDILNSQLILGCLLLFPTVILSLNSFIHINVILITQSYVFGVILVTLYGFFMTKKTIKYNLMTFDKKSDIFSINISLYLIALVNIIIMWGGSFLLGLWCSLEDVGAYNVISRIAFLMNFILISLSTMLSVQVGRLLAQGDKLNAERVINKAVYIGAIAGLPLFLVFMFFPDVIVSFFGEEYTSYSTLLIILSIGQYFSLLSGPVGNVLIVSGHEKIMRNIMLLSALFVFILTVIFIKLWGVYGAALAAMSILIVQNFIAMYYVKKKLNINIFIFKLIKRI